MIIKSKKHQLKNIQEYINVTWLLTQWQPTSAHSMSVLRFLLTAPTAFNRFAHICSSLLCSSCHIHCWFVCFIINVAVFWKQCRTISHSFSLAVSPRGGPSPTSGTTRGIYSAWLMSGGQEHFVFWSTDTCATQFNKLMEVFCKCKNTKAFLKPFTWYRSGFSLDILPGTCFS